MEQEEHGNGPCRKVGRSRKRNLTPYHPDDQVEKAALLKHNGLDTCQDGFQQEQIDNNGNRTHSRNSFSKNDQSTTSSSLNNTNDIWFTNSFVRTTSSNEKRNTTCLVDREVSQRFNSVPKKMRLDVEFSQKISDVNLEGDTVGHNTYDTSTETRSTYFPANGCKSNLGCAVDDKASSSSPNIFHSTPVKNIKNVKTEFSDTLVLLRTEADDTFNTSDRLLAGLDDVEMERTDYFQTKGENSASVSKGDHSSSDADKFKSLTKGDKSKTLAQVSSLSHVKNRICSGANLIPNCDGSVSKVGDNSKKENLNSQIPQDKSCANGAEVAASKAKHPSVITDESSRTPVSSSLYEGRVHKQCVKQRLSVSDDNIFDGDFLSQIDSLEKQTDTKTETDKRNFTERTTGGESIVNRSETGHQVEEKCAKGSKMVSDVVKPGSRSETSSQAGKSLKSRSNLETAKIEGQKVSSSPVQLISNGAQVQGRTDMTTPEASSGSKTPSFAGLGGSLKDRIKRRLQENASSKLINSPGMLMKQRREDVVSIATTEAEQIRKQGSDVDIGPFYGLSSNVRVLLQQHRGINTLYEWQDECLRLPAVLEGRNLIYSLPTSGGKTLVAEILIMRELLCKKRDAILILPFVSIVQEKVRGLSPFGVELDFLVEEYAGSKGKFPPLKRRKRQSLYIATIEKAHSLVNSLIENQRIDSLGLVVVDELHMIGDGSSRGATLESTLLKIIYTQKNTQIVGMSATLGNISDLQVFLGAEVYSNNFRPVELTEYAKLQDNIYLVNQTAKCLEDQFTHDRVVMFKYPADMTRVDGDHLLGLVLEVIPEKSCLLFCPTKKNCENVAMMLSKLMVKYHHELSKVKKAERKALLKELYTDGAGKICPILQYTVHFGVAYHHSGLTTDERRLIEDGYSDGTLCLLACTSTLAAGVNLPAKRVILRSPYVGSQFISRSQYKQMVGRAGRAGIDTSGESILITKPSDMEKVGALLTAPVEVCHSSLMHDDRKGIRGLILSAVGLQMTPTTRDVFACMEKTLLSVQASRDVPCNVRDVTRQSLQQLLDLGLVVQKRALSQEIDEDVHQLEVTMLGRATFKGSVNLDWSGRLYNDLHQGVESLVLSSHLHLLYLVTPYDMVSAVKPSWIVYFQEMSTLNPAELKMAALIGVPEGYVTKKASGQNSRQKVDEFVVSRFYLTLMLYGLWRQQSVWDVADKFQQPRGFIQNLLSSAASFASCVYHFCQELDEFWQYQDLLVNFVKRLAYCVTSELIPLMEIPGVKLGRAKQLYSVGYKTLPHVANADPEDLVRSIKQIPRKIARQIVSSAKMLLNEKAEALWQEVEDLVMVPNAVPTHPSPDVSSQGSIASSEILNGLADWDGVM